MAALLRRVAVCRPQASGWADPSRASQWQGIGYRHPPSLVAAQAQHDLLCRELESFGAEVVLLEGDEQFSLDGVYVHDPSFIADAGAICLRMGKDCRTSEPRRHREFYASLGIPVLGSIEEPGTVEAGDMVWLDSTTLLVGRGYRTNQAGVEQLQTLLAPAGVEVITAPLPHGAGPASCLHLMSLMSLLDERTALVDLGWLAVETVEVLRERGFRLIDIHSSERDSLACNVLALGNGTLLAFRENRQTIERLGRAGFTVKSIPGSEIGINGGGGPTCLTRPLLRR
jgi:N-dimethylarginine dimethylaminohydrolase